MAVPTADEFLDRFPEFREQAIAVVEGALGEAENITPASLWGTLQFEGVCYLAAHSLAMRTYQIGIQIGQATSAPPGTGYEATLYGVEYKRLMNTLTLTGFAL